MVARRVNEGAHACTAQLQFSLANASAYQGDADLCSRRLFTFLTTPVVHKYKRIARPL
jgi:hypothetical protein